MSGVSVSLAAGNATFPGGSNNDNLGNDSVLGNTGSDSIDGGPGDDTLSGGSGFDILLGGIGNDSLLGGALSDRVSYANASGSVMVDLGAGSASGADGDDTLGEIEGITGSNYNDTLLGREGSGNDVIFGGNGDDSIDGRGNLASIERLSGGNGNDTISADMGFSSSGLASVNGGAGDDLLFVRSGAAATGAAGAATANGGSGDDTLISEAAASGARLLLGDDVGTGNDSIVGSTLSETIDGVEGDDTLRGGGGNDTLSGGNGTDWVSYSDATGAITVDLPAGRAYAADGISTLSGIENVLGGNFNDIILSDAGNNILDGGLGNDTIMAGGGERQTLLGDGGADSLLGSSGNEHLLGGSENDTLSGSAGNDTLEGGNGDDRLDGGADDDSLNGGSGADTLLGGAGNDTVIGALGADSLLGGTEAGTVDVLDYSAETSAVTLTTTNATLAGGNDSLSSFEVYLTGSGDDSINIVPIGNGSGTVISGAGNDTIVSRLWDGALLDGGAGDDSLWGRNSNHNHTLLGGSGNDTLIAAGGNTIDGGNDTDLVSFVIASGPFATAPSSVNLVTGEGTNGGMGSVTLLSIENVLTGNGNDTIIGDGQNNRLISGDGNDWVEGGAGNDWLEGGADNDTLWGGADNDTMLGGTGRDLVDYSYVTGHGVTVSLTDETAYGGSQDSLIGIEDVFGSNQDDVLTGDANDNLLNGLGDNDSLSGLAGNDTLLGDEGNDTLNGGSGDDSLLGGNGTDFANYSEATDAVTVDLGAATQSASGGAGQDTLSGIENLIGSNHDDVLIGDAGANTILGGYGADTISGGNGNDWLDFGDGNERFSYQPADSFGNDTLIGGAGQDTLDLGTGWRSGPEAAGWVNYTRSDGTTIWTQGWETVVCFAEGTRIVTPNGEDAVQNLRAGDMVLAMRNGQAGFEPLRWVGFMDVAVPRNAVMAAKTAPVLIKAGAIAPGMPARDLRVSPDHAMEVDGHLIPAKHLVNGESIIQEIWCKRVRYFHLELEAHGLLLSEGTWSESYLDDGNRHAFNNAALTGLFLDFEAGRSQGQYDHQACLPVLRQGLKLDEIHGRIALRAGELAEQERARRRA